MKTSDIECVHIHKVIIFLELIDEEMSNLRTSVQR